MVVTLLSPTSSDGTFHHLEDVDPRGRVAYITEGQLRAIHRRFPATAAAVPPGGPLPNVREQGRVASSPGRDCLFDLLLTSYSFQPGHRTASPSPARTQATSPSAPVAH